MSTSEYVILMRSFCFEAEDGIRCLVRSSGLKKVYKRQEVGHSRRIFLVHGAATRERAGREREDSQDRDVACEVWHWRQHTALIFMEDDLGRDRSAAIVLVC